MNYRHAFHAGNFADVLKHVVLTLCIEHLNKKPSPWRYIDTHAGIGLYDLTGDESERSPEWRDGILRVWEAVSTAPAEVRGALAPFLSAIREANAGEILDTYPGSPRIVASMAREGDAVRLCELHEPSADLLREAMGRDRRVKVELRDGYEALVAYLPPAERRGLVLIDPPFEAGRADAKSDYAWTLRALRKALKRWPDGIYCIWRPIKDVEAVDAFDSDVATLAIEEAGLPPDKLLVADLWVRGLDSGSLAGAGLIILNPPYGLEDKLSAVMPWLANVMDKSPDTGPSQSGWRLQTAGESG